MLDILLADDHAMIRRGLRAAIEGIKGWRVCGEASTGREAVELALRLRPHVAIIDLTMPELNGIEITRRIRKALPDTEVLIFTMYQSEEAIREALKAGARGFLLKSDAELQIVSAIQALSEHKPFFIGEVSETLIDGFLAQPTVGDANRGHGIRLTPREREILQLLAEGNSNKAVAGLLNISPKTVDAHRTALMRKLKIRSLSELVRYAVRNKLIDA